MEPPNIWHIYSTMKIWWSSSPQCWRGEACSTGWRRKREMHRLPAVGIVTADVCQSQIETGQSSYDCRMDWNTFWYIYELWPDILPPLKSKFSIPMPESDVSHCWATHTSDSSILGKLGEIFSRLREDIRRKKTFSFGHCPNHLNPPPLTPIRATWSSFFTPKTTFCAYDRKKNWCW